MIKALVLFFFAWPVLVLAQDQAAAARAAAGCGADGVDFEVKTDKSKHPIAEPDPGKALVYVLEYEKRNPGFNIGGITTRVGLDGHWVGANHGTSYFFFSVNPGEHRLCTNWQSSLKSLSKLGSATSFLAEAGKVYFFRVEVELRPDHAPAVRMDPVDSADGQFQISSSSFSTSHPKEIAKE